MAADFFIKIDGIDGESTDADHAKWIEVQSLSWGVQRNVGMDSYSATTGGTSSGRAMLGTVNFSKAMDKATTKLMEYCATGKHSPKAEIHFCQAGDGDKKHTYMKYTLENVVVASYDVGAGGDYRPNENISLVYETIETGYKDLTNKGAGGAELKFKYSASENKKV